MLSYMLSKTVQVEDGRFDSDVRHGMGSGPLFAGGRKSDILHKC